MTLDPTCSIFDSCSIVQKGHNNLAFASLLQLGDTKVCTDLLITTVWAPEAVLFALPSMGKHEVIKVGRHDARRDGTVGGGSASIWSSTSSFSLCSWTGSMKNDIEPNVEEMGCKNVPVWVWTRYHTS